MTALLIILSLGQRIIVLPSSLQYTAPEDTYESRNLGHSIPLTSNGSYSIWHTVGTQLMLTELNQ